jgi:hypothetical protein
MAGDRPAVIGEERVKCIHHDVIDVSDLLHIPPWYGDWRLKPQLLTLSG